MIKKIIQGLGLAAALYVSPALGFDYLERSPTNGYPYKWEIPTDQPRVIEYEIDPIMGPMYEAAFQRAAQKWSNTLEGKIVFVKGAKENGIYITKQSFENLNDSLSPLAHIEPAGITKNEYDPATTTITKSTIIFNSDFTWTEDDKNQLSGDTNVDDIATHELGHALGMGHSRSYSPYPQNPWADGPTMQAAVRGKGIAKTLHADDIAGIRTLYGLPIPSIEPLTIIVKKQKGRKFVLGLVEEAEVDDKVAWDFGYGMAAISSDTGKELTRVLQPGLRIITAEWNGRIGVIAVQSGKRKLLPNLHPPKYSNSLSRSKKTLENDLDF